MSRFIAALLIFVSMVCLGQNENTELRGVITMRDGSVEPLDKYQVILSPTGMGTETHSAWVSGDGSFSFKRVPSGTYEYVMVNARGTELAHGLVQLPFMPELRIELEGHAAPPRGPVSLYQLRHKTNGKALKTLQRAFHLAQEKEYGQAMGLVEESLRLDPGFTQALHLKGLLLLQTREFIASRKVLTAAAGLDDGNPALLADTAIACLAADSPEEAERYARKSLRLNPEQGRAKLVLNALETRPMGGMAKGLR